jgi:hypothetical protein
VIKTNGTEKMRIRANGRVGIGTDNPSVRLHLEAPDGSGIDRMARFSVENADGFIQLENRSTVSGDFAGSIRGECSSSNWSALHFPAQVASGADNGSVPVIQFDPRLPSGPIVNRPLFLWSNNNNPKMQMDANGNLGIGTTGPQGKLHVNGSLFANLSTDPTLGTNSVFMDGGELKEYTSTLNHKTEIEDVQFDKETFLSLRPVDFMWKESYGGKADVGLIAEEVEQLMPNMVNYHYKHTYINQTTGEFLRDSTGAPVLDSTQLQPWGVDYRKISVYLLALVKEQDSHINDMEHRLANIESRVENCCISEPSYRMMDPDNGDSENGVQLKVYPNPTGGECTIEYAMPDNQIGNIYLVGMSGEKTLLMTASGAIGKETFTLSGSPGVYELMLEMGDAETVVTKRIILTK